LNTIAAYNQNCLLIAILPAFLRFFLQASHEHENMNIGSAADPAAGMRMKR
jgi:hypothetical protein